jgi:hypothetical protein
LLQCIGIVFIGTFLIAYLAELPTGEVLHAQPVYHEVLAISGSVFVIMSVFALFLSFVKRNA